MVWPSPPTGTRRFAARPRHARRRAGAVAAAAALAAPSLFGLVVLLTVPLAEASTVSLTLYTTTRGWGYSSTNITSPGPTITVNEGDIVQLSLNGADNAWHNFFVDYNDDGDEDPGAGEPVSSDFRSPNAVSFSFTADVAGNFTYICGYHTRFAYGAFIVIPAPPGNSVPSVALEAPTATAWTGGSVQTLEWNQSDAQEPAANLSAWLNYSASSGPGTIAGPLTGSSNPQAFDWSVPRVNATGVRVNLTVADSEGLQAFDEKDFPDIDSASPTVVTVSPAPDAVGVDPPTTLQVDFSESMQRAPTEGAVSLAAGGPPVALTTLGWSGNNLLLQPVTALANDTLYTVTVGAGALDASDPGNSLQPYTWSFRTVNHAPTAAFVAPAAGASWSGDSLHDIAWAAADSDEPTANLTMSVSYSPTGEAPWTSVFGPVAGDSSPQPWTVPADDTAAARLNLSVTDSSGLSLTRLSSPFSVDSAAPGVAAVYPADGATGVVRNSMVSVRFSEPMSPGATEASVALIDVGAATWVQGSVRWSSAGDEILFTPESPLGPNAAYRILVNATALDASAPGNALGTDQTFAFNTSAISDATPPTVVSTSTDPASQGPGLPVTLSVEATDDAVVGAVWANVTGPAGEFVTNMTLAGPNGSVWTGPVTSTLLGVHTVAFWVCDSAANCVAASGTFSIADVLPPVVSDLQVEPSRPLAPGSVTLSASATDDSQVAEVWVLLGVENRTATLDASTGRYAATFDLAGAGTFTFTVGARDASGSVNTTSSTFTAFDDVPPQVGGVTVEPAVQELGLATTVLAQAADNLQVVDVWVVVDGLGNFSMAPDASAASRFSASIPGAALGSHTFEVWASDTSGNLASATGAFEVHDTQPPTIDHAAVAAGHRGDPIDLVVTADDLDGVAGVFIIYTGTNGREENLSAAPNNAGGYAATLPAQTLSGNLTYAVAAVDGSGNWATVGPFTVSIPADVEPPKEEDLSQIQDLLPAVVALAVAEGALAGALFAHRRRRARAAAGAAEVVGALEARIPQAMAALLAVAGVAGILLLYADTHLWDTAPDHAWALVAFTAMDFGMAGALLLRPARFTHAAALWGAGQASLMLADLITAPQYNLTYTQFAVYLFSQEPFVLILAVSVAALIFGNHALGGLRSTLAFWRALSTMAGKDGGEAAPPSE